MWPFRKKTVQKELAAADDRGWFRIFDFRTGAWQTHDAYTGSENVLQHSATFSCISLISGDIAKLKPQLLRQTGKIWTPTDAKEFPVLAKPNAYENHIRFKQRWVQSKLTHGNTYALKQRDGNRVTALHILDPEKVTPLISDSGEAFYKLSRTRLAGVQTEITVPAREILHDRWNCLSHPLIGLPPIFASAIAGQLGLSIQQNAKHFFANASNAGGLLLAPGPIADETAKRLKEQWESKFSGDKSGKVAVLGDNLKFESMRMTNVDSQLIETMKMTAETVASVFHVPLFMVGGQMPTHNNIESLIVLYYAQCLQGLIEDYEACLDEGLGVPAQHRVQLDLDGLFRMDSATLIESLARGTGAGIYSPNEARAKLNLPPVDGGESPLMQQQNYSLAALAQRGNPE